MRRLALRLLLPISATLSGCSFVFVQPLPPHYSLRDLPDCTTSHESPNADLGFAVGTVGGVAYWAARDSFQNAGTLAVVAFVAAAPWMASAIYGYNKTTACAKAEQVDGPAPYIRPRPPRPRLLPPPAAILAHPPGEEAPVTPAPRQADPADGNRAPQPSDAR